MSASSKPLQLVVSDKHTVDISVSVASQVQALYEETNHAKRRWLLSNPYKKLLQEAEKVLATTLKEVQHPTLMLIEIDRLFGMYNKLLPTLNSKVSRSDRELLKEIHLKINAILRDLKYPTIDCPETYYFVGMSKERILQFAERLNKVGKHIPPTSQLEASLVKLKDQTFSLIIGEEHYIKWIKLAA